MTLPTPCIEWTGYTDRRGYGQRRYHGKNEQVHRIAFFEAHGYWPKICRHMCHNPPCYNVEHLQDGTHADNLRDRREKDGHVNGGEFNGQAVLTEAQVVDIKRRLDSEGRGIGELLAYEYGVSPATICDIKKGRTWAHVAS